MTVIFADTETASDIGHGATAIMTHDDRTVDLRQYSLNAVVAHNKSLWRPPRLWTQANLRALCVDHQSDVNADVDDLDRDTDGLSLHALIPDLHQDRLKHFIATMGREVEPRARAVALNAMLAFPGPPPRPMHEDVDTDVDVGVGSSPRLDLHTKPIPFSYYDDCIMRLAVGRRTYRLPLLFSFRLGPLMLAYLDSAQINWPFRRVNRGRLSNQPYEPCIAAVLIAMAQKPGSCADKSTQLIFTHRDDDQDMHVYTARVSQPLLERFRHPNRPPTARACSHTTPSLIKLQHIRVPYEPNDTFRCRILAAVSVTATTMHENDYLGRRKRKASHVCDAIDLKRCRR